MLQSEFRWADRKTSWDYIEEFYQKDKSYKNRTAPKLTNSHVAPGKFEKLRVKYATQILSATVAAGLEMHINLKSLPEAAVGTLEFVEQFDKLFDIFNSSTFNTAKTYRKPFSGEDYQISFLQESLNFLNKLKVFNKENKDITAYVKSIRCWCISIQALIILWEKLMERNFSFILTRRINQDSLENFFGSIRQQGGNAVNPTPIQFKRAFAKLFLTDFLHAEKLNCAEDFDEMLSTMSDFSARLEISDDEHQHEYQPFAIDHCDYHLQSLPEQNAFKYVCGYLINKCLQKHSCDICLKFSKENDDLDDSNLFIHFKAYNKEYNLFGALKTPCENFYNYIYKLETLFF